MLGRVDGLAALGYRVACMSACALALTRRLIDWRTRRNPLFFFC